MGGSRSGLHSERSHAARDRTACGPVGGWTGPNATARNKQALARSNWRNARFASWRRALASGGGGGGADPGGAIDAVLPVHALLLSRHDAHVPQDCTHFCYSPFLWTPLWSALARQLRARALGPAGRSVARL